MEFLLFYNFKNNINNVVRLYSLPVVGIQVYIDFENSAIYCVDIIRYRYAQNRTDRIC